MPLPLGHTAIALATYEVSPRRDSAGGRFGLLFGVAVLANLPDIDVLIGLILQGNGHLSHRGPTHSLLFAGLAGYLASAAGRRWPRLPRFGFATAFALVMSHILADSFFTRSPVSFLWPLEVHWSAGVSTWGDVVQSVLFEGLQDIGLIVLSAAVIGLSRFLRSAVAKGRPAFKG
jgi:membrane-bound metal-dependent hydrolase YbcI (DUF457 family)